MASKQKRPMEISPVGEIQFAWLNKPQPPHPKNRSKDAKAKYSVTLLFPINDLKVIAWGKAVKAILPDTHYPFKIDKETGNLQVKFSSAFAPRVVDAKRNDLPPGRLPAKGSIVKVAYVAEPYDTGSNKGVTLYLQGIQVLTLKEFERKQLPFTDEEGFERDPNDKGVAEHAAGAAHEEAAGDRPPDDDAPPPDDEDSRLPF
jgi:hypothetical protein